jgi:hypothetical protein
MVKVRKSARSRRSTVRKRCTGITRQGDQCRNPAVPGSATCVMHQPAADPEPRPVTAW